MVTYDSNGSSEIEIDASEHESDLLIPVSDERVEVTVRPDPNGGVMGEISSEQNREQLQEMYEADATLTIDIRPADSDSTIEYMAMITEPGNWGWTGERLE